MERTAVWLFSNVPSYEVGDAYYRGALFEPTVSACLGFPLSFVAEAFGLQPSWDGEAGIARFD